MAGGPAVVLLFGRLYSRRPTSANADWIWDATGCVATERDSPRRRVSTRGAVGGWGACWRTLQGLARADRMAPVSRSAAVAQFSARTGSGGPLLRAACVGSRFSPGRYGTNPAFGVAACPALRGTLRPSWEIRRETRIVPSRRVPLGKQAVPHSLRRHRVAPVALRRGLCRFGLDLRCLHRVLFEPALRRRRRARFPRRFPRLRPARRH